MAADSPDWSLIVFAKAPVPGEVKTRLAPALDPFQAAMLHAAMVERVLGTATRAGAGYVELCAAPDDGHPFFADCADEFDVGLASQGEGDLGTRMHRALARALDDNPRAIVIGSDCLAFDERHLDAAAAALDTHDAVITPAEDGGYVLIGVRRVADGLFDGIEWGTDGVVDAQRDRFRELGWRWHEMPTLWDVDRPADLDRVKALKPPLAFSWPA